MNFGSLTARTVAALTLLALVVGFMFAVILDNTRGEKQAATSSRRAEDRVAVLSGEQRLLVDVETGIRGWLITGERRFLQPFEAARTALPAAEARLLALEEDPADRREVRYMHGAINAYLREYAIPLATAAPPRSRAERARVTADGKERMDRLRLLVADYARGETAESDARAAAANRHAGRMTEVAAAGLSVSVLLVLLVAIYQLRWVLAPVRRVGTAARRIAMGDLTARVEEEGGGEVGELAHSFNVMATSLEYTRDELERQNTELAGREHELQLTVEDLAAQKALIERFQEFAGRLAELTEIEPLADAILDRLAAVADADAGALYVYVAEAGEAALVGVRGLDRDSLPANVSLSAPGGLPVAHELHLPLVQGDRGVGVITLGRWRDVPFTRADVDAVEQLAERAAVGVAAAVSLRTARNQAVLTSAVLDTAADAFVSLDGTGAITHWNRAAEEMFGIPAGDAVGRALVDVIVPPRFRERYSEVMSTFAGGGDWPLVGSNELTALRPDGTEFTVEATITPLRLGDRLQFNAFVRDVSARKRLEQYREALYRVTRGLSESATLDEARLAVLDGLGSALGFSFGATLIPSEDGQRLHVTSTWAGGDDDFAALAGAGRAISFARGEGIGGRVWESGEAIFVHEFAEETTAGASRTAVEASGLRSGVAFPAASGGHVLGVGMLFWDTPREPDPDLLAMITTVGSQIGQFIARKRAEVEADRLKDEFFALVSHELRTPLTSIIGYLELVLEEDGVDPDTRRFLEVVDRNAGRLLRLVGDLLFVAQVEAGELSLDPGPVDFGTVCAESVEAARPRAVEAQVELVLDAQRVRPLHGDSGRLGQAVDNLVSNAIKFTPPGGRVEVALRESGDDVVVEVSDTGVGIPAAEQERLFDRFFRSQSAGEQAVPGVGLGLTIVRAIVDGHGGEVAVSSEEGRGTTFRVRVPRALADVNLSLTQGTPTEVQR